MSGGRGCIIFTTTDGQWVDGEVCNMLTAAAYRLGFALDGWMAVVQAVGHGCLPDLLSEAIEAAEALGAEQAEAAE